MVSTIDGDGAWAELTKGQVDLQKLEFPPDTWSIKDVCALLQGLFEAGQSRQAETLTMLRKLRLHALRGHPDERVSVADAEGNLAEHIVLDTTGFEAGLPADLKSLWQDFLSGTKIVEQLPADNLAATVQRQIFQRVDADGEVYISELDWNYVVRHSLEAEVPRERAQLILEALSHGDESVRGLGQKLKNTAWLPLELGGGIAPNSVVHIEGLEDDLHHLLDAKRDGLAGIRAVSDWVSTHDGFPTLRNYLPRIEQSLGFLGLWMAEKTEWHLGLSKESSPGELEPILSLLEDFENLPVAALFLKLRRVRVRGREDGIAPLLSEHILPAISKPFAYANGGLDKLGAILRRLQGQQPPGKEPKPAGSKCISWMPLDRPTESRSPPRGHRRPRGERTGYAGPRAGEATTDTPLTTHRFQRRTYWAGGPG